MTDCPHRTASRCAIVADVAGLPDTPLLTPEACEFCTSRAVPPQSLNEVTVSLACGELNRAGAMERHRQVLTQHGHLLRKVMPSWAEQAWSVATAVADWIAQGAPIVSADIYQQRLERCDVCPNRNGHRCKNCGCFIRGKAGMPTERCPIGLW